MTKLYRLAFLLSVICLTGLTELYAQRTVISGNIVDESGESLIGVNILVKGTVNGTISDVQGNFSLSVSSAPPITLVVTSIGYQAQEIEITSATVNDMKITMAESVLIGQEVVVSASRVEESILQSPVSIEKMDIRSIRESAAPSFYDQIANFKGVDVSTQSLTFKSINPRGFGANGNTRTVQLIDGIDNQAPGLNFPVGNIVGISEVDLESVEILPGAASALYGPNAIQGIILMNSKSPFEYQGLSASAQLGLTHADGADDDAGLYNNYQLRYAKAFNNKFAFKITGSYLQAQDWRGVDFRDQGFNDNRVRNIVERSPNINPDDRSGFRTYDGVNVYGDPTVNIGDIVAGSSVATLGPLGPEGDFTPTGYTEAEFVDNTTESIKLGGALHYRINDKMEILGQVNWGQGSTVYTANDRFVLDNFNIWTGKLELKGSNFFVRGYTTQENSGDSFAANTLASLINEQTTIPAYINSFLGARLDGATIEQAHDEARVNSDNLRQANLENGRFQALYDSLREVPISQGGAQFLDETSLYHAEAMYNLSNQIDFAEIIIGGNFRRYNLKSGGTLFALENIDEGDEFSISEYGAYAQIAKKVADERLALSGSIRYDKNEFFAGQFSPRLSGVYTAGGKRNHNLRFSFQRGFRIPTTQDQFINLDVRTRRLVGSNQSLVDQFNFITNPVYNNDDINEVRAGNKTVDELQPWTDFEFETEKVSTFELGYKSLIGNKLLIDGYIYLSNYTDFITEVTLAQDASTLDPNVNGVTLRYIAPSGGVDPATLVAGNNVQLYGFDVNSDETVTALGWAVSAEYLLDKGYTFGGNLSWNELRNDEELRDKGFFAQFNTPEWRYNIKFSNRKVTDRLGFNIQYRWQDAFVWESSFGQGVVPAFGSLDAQVSYKIPDLKSIFKIGGSNITNNRYTTSFGNPRVGSLYYIAISFDEFLN
ncbi:MAG: carboxypeptidase-like regulatory domain-containing protein [Bacteroidota bacterium]